MDSQLFGAYAFYSALLAAKWMVMSFWTAKQRFGEKIFANPEDAATDKKSKVSYVNERVERVRRCHQNDIENIAPFFILGALYVTTNPVYGFALNLFRTFTAARFLHTFVYLNEIPQPSRALAFFVNMICNWYMVYAVVSHYM